jgi:uncharacterized membrane protein SpoIIM required for sporulation
MRSAGTVMILIVMLLIANSSLAQEQSPDSSVSKVERQVNDKSGGAALFLFGAFCALWAQNTGRNAWLWFFMGLFFNVITVFVLLYKNANDPRRLTVAHPT